MTNVLAQEVSTLLDGIKESLTIIGETLKKRGATNVSHVAILVRGNDGIVDSACIVNKGSEKVDPEILPLALAHCVVDHDKENSLNRAGQFLYASSQLLKSVESGLTGGVIAAEFEGNLIRVVCLAPTGVNRIEYGRAIVAATTDALNELVH